MCRRVHVARASVCACLCDTNIKIFTRHIQVYLVHLVENNIHQHIVCVCVCVWTENETTKTLYSVETYET